MRWVEKRKQERKWKNERRRRGRLKRLEYEYIKKCFEDKGCELLEDTYVNNSTKMKYKCKCGEIGYVKFNNFVHNEGCVICNNKPKHSYEYVYNYFKNCGYELLETEYINDATQMKYNKDDQKYTQRANLINARIVDIQRKNLVQNKKTDNNFVSGFRTTVL
jgi:hypothetical protein